MDFAALAELCAPGVAAHTMKSIASVESSFNPFAIGVVGGQLQRQPRDIDEAVATAQMLEASGFNYSVGLVQVNKSNFAKFGVTSLSLFDPCTNLRVGALIFGDCLERAGGSANPTGDALSCYYSGNFKTGYSHGYVAKVLGAGGSVAAQLKPLAIPVTRSPRRKSGRLKAPTASVQKSDPLFVAATESPVNDVVPRGDATQPTKARETALLF